MRHGREKLVFQSIGDFGRLARLLHGVEQPRVLYRNRALRRQPGDDALVTFREDVGLGVAEEQAAEFFSRSADHRDREIAADGRVASRNAAMRVVLAVARIFGHVTEADDCLAPQGRPRKWP